MVYAHVDVIEWMVHKWNVWVPVILLCVCSRRATRPPMPASRLSQVFVSKVWMHLPQFGCFPQSLMIWLDRIWYIETSVHDPTSLYRSVESLDVSGWEEVTKTGVVGHVTKSQLRCRSRSWVSHCQLPKVWCNTWFAAGGHWKDCWRPTNWSAPKASFTSAWQNLAGQCDNVTMGIQTHKAGCWQLQSLTVKGTAANT